MNHSFQLEAIGEVYQDQDRKLVRIFEKFVPGLTQIERFSHLEVIWWGHLADDPERRNNLLINRLFKKAPPILGVFSTRAPLRPNPILLTTIQIDEIDTEKGIIIPKFIDAEPGSPILDIKPYYPMNRVKHVQVPDWCEHWPQWAEEAAGYDWQEEMNF